MLSAFTNVTIIDKPLIHFEMPQNTEIEMLKFIEFFFIQY